jgi:hypothetical protein
MAREWTQQMKDDKNPWRKSQNKDEGERWVINEER